MNQTTFTAPAIIALSNPNVLAVPMAEWFTELSADVQADITEMNEAGYPLSGIRDFIEQYGVEAYSNGHYVTWCQLIDESLLPINDAIKAYVEEVGINYISNFENDFVGEYESEEDFARSYFDGNYYGIDVLEDNGVVIDWQATWDSNLSHHYAYNNGFVFNTNK